MSGGALVLLIWVIFQARLRRMTALLDARFEERLLERTRIARALHDTVLQTVQATRMAAENSLADDSPVEIRTTLKRVIYWLATASAEARRAVQELRDTSDADDGLVQSLRTTAEQLRRDGLFITVSMQGNEPTLPSAIRDEIYRIGREALVNAITHAEATMIEVNLRCEPGFELDVQDNGRGIAQDVIRDGVPGHFGLLGMRERAALLGGVLTITVNENGTLVSLSIPEDATKLWHR